MLNPKKLNLNKMHIVSVPLGFNLINRVTDTLESSSILIYSVTHGFIYTKNSARCHIN